MQTIVLTRGGRALVYLTEGNSEDVGKACEFADKEGYAVYLYPTTENDPLGRAKWEHRQYMRCRMPFVSYNCLLGVWEVKRFRRSNGCDLLAAYSTEEKAIEALPKYRIPIKL